MEKMIHDYYLFEAYLNENIEIQAKKLARKKTEKLNRKEENIEKEKSWEISYPKKTELEVFPQNSVIIKITFKLKKPFLSKGAGEFHFLGKGITENSLARDKIFRCPIIRASGWKGNLRFASERVSGLNMNKTSKGEIIRRLFGSKPDEENQLKGRLYFFPTFFNNGEEKDAITPLKRKSRTPARGPIIFEVIKKETQGEFYLLYFPYPKSKEYNKEEQKEDLIFLVKTLNLMFYTFGFSAKKSSGFGVIENALEGVFWIKKNKKINEFFFSNLNELEKKISDNSFGENNEL